MWEISQAQLYAVFLSPPTGSLLVAFYWLFVGIFSALFFFFVWIFAFMFSLLKNGRCEMGGVAVANT